MNFERGCSWPSLWGGMCTPWSLSISHTCAHTVGWLVIGATVFIDFALVGGPPMYYHKLLQFKECTLASNAFKYNFQQRISWLSHRWRTQRNAISNVNCRIQWIIESLNAPCAPWYSEEHACLSVMEFSTLFAFVNRAWIWRFIAGTCDRLLLNALARTFADQLSVW